MIKHTAKEKGQLSSKYEQARLEYEKIRQKYTEKR